jgi:hypothetical protein
MRQPFEPRVGALRQPWALGRNPVGIGHGIRGYAKGIVSQSPRLRRMPLPWVDGHPAKRTPVGVG